MKETFLIIDTETTKEGKNMPNQSVFDIGWTISNRNGEILATRSYIVEQFRLQALEKKKAFLIDSDIVDKATYITKILNREMKVASWSAIMGQLTKDCKKYNVGFIGAYNLGFDTNVINKTHFYFTEKIVELFETTYLIDLYHACAYTILSTPEYRTFAEKHNLKTDKGNLKTSAEATYRFIINDNTYIEEHTAFQDSLDETKILHYLLNNVDIPLQAWTINSQAWRIVNPKKEE